MKRILITGATGNVGLEVIKSLHELDHSFEVVAGIRDFVKEKDKLAEYAVSLIKFDFTDFSTHQAALTNCDTLFLLRPPQISDVNTYFKPLIDTAKATGVKHIIFLSVQGVENSKFIPHHKIEKLIVDSQIPYTFLRPAYFMQNFSTTLRDDLVNKNRIFLPAGHAKFTLIDVRDIGRVAAQVLTNPADYLNKAFDLTCREKLTFEEMAEKLSKGLGKMVQYQSPNPLKFYLIKRKEQVPSGFILVMIMLHYFPRFQKEPLITDWVKKITSQQPKTFEQFIQDHKTLLT
ncbi:MAG: NmrA family NAD(P)-binding protein [Cytophagaceae bacterium]|nr:NmrA family NAD(P)-binding protein [Cytophagaceae bacterium]